MKNKDGQDIITISETRHIVGLLQKKLPSQVNSSIRIYVIDDSNQIRSFNFNYLEMLFDLQYKEKQESLNEFIYKTVNQNKELNDNDFTKKMYGHTIDFGITKLYNKHKIDGLHKKFTIFDPIENNYTLQTDNLNSCQLETISYFYFINKYFRFNNCAANRITFRKIKIAEIQ